MASTNILVTGGTGRVGTLVVPRLVEAGYHVRTLSRSGGKAAGDDRRLDGVEHVTGDLVEDRGVAAAVRDHQVILHLAGGPKGDDVAARNLVRAAKAAGVEKIVFISVTGADTVPVKWLQTKYAAEQAIIASGIPFTIIRAAQFHYLTYAAVSTLAKLPIVPVPGGLRFQPIDTTDVADRLFELTLAAPAGRVRDLVGPETLGMRELIESVLRAQHKRRLTVPMRIPGKAGHAYRAGANLTEQNADHGTVTWESFLAQEVEVPVASNP